MKIIVPFGAGGSGDTLARVVADHLSATFKQQFVVENRTGAGGMIGTQAIAAAPPDGSPTRTRAPRIRPGRWPPGICSGGAGTGS